MTASSNKSKSQRLVSALLAWFATSARDLPWRRTRDPYAIWISEIMLQQTQVKTVIPYWNRWMTALPNVKSLADASPETVLKLWEGLGYYTRARNLQRAAQLITTQHNGRFPENFDAILALPGVGRYTAGAISSIAFNQPAPILDGNVIRVITRLFDIAANPKEKAVNEQLWTLARELVETAHNLPEQCADNVPRCSHLNQSLMELGALICTPQNPRCAECPVQLDCAAHRAGRAAELPNLRPRTKATERRVIAFVIEHNGRLLVRQRPTAAVNAHLWEFPNAEVGHNPAAITHADSRDSLAQFAREQLGLPLTNFAPLITVRHSITRYRITLKAHRARWTGKSNAAKNAGRWLTVEELHALAFTSAHRKILKHLQTTAVTC